MHTHRSQTRWTVARTGAEPPPSPQAQRCRCRGSTEADGHGGWTSTRPQASRGASPASPRPELSARPARDPQPSAQNRGLRPRTTPLTAEEPRGQRAGLLCSVCGENVTGDGDGDGCLRPRQRRDGRSTPTGRRPSARSPARLAAPDFPIAASGTCRSLRGSSWTPAIGRSALWAACEPEARPAEGTCRAAPSPRPSAARVRPAAP